MGFYDRPYAQRDSSRASVLGAMRAWSMTTWLAVLLLAVYLVNGFTRSEVNDFEGWLYRWGSLSVADANGRWQWWRLATFQFIHAGVVPIFFNLLALCLLGPFVEFDLGPRRYLVFYLLCGVAAAPVYVALWYLGVIHADTYHGELIGAAGAILGVLIAAAQAAPDLSVQIPWVSTPVSIRVMVWVVFAAVGWAAFAGGQSFVGPACCFAGAAVGALLVWRPGWLDILCGLGGRSRHKPRTRHP